jgi:hypothetical protein
MLNGWGGYVLTGANYVNAFFSHDEYIRFFGRVHPILRLRGEQSGRGSRGIWGEMKSVKLAPKPIFGDT